jgi:hypothetical protein
MRDLALLRDLGDQVRPPDFESLERVARRRSHRTAVAVTAACAAVLVVVGGGVVVSSGDSAAPPVGPVAPTVSPSVEPTPRPTDDRQPTPGTRTSMTPREVVNADNAILEAAGMSLDDPDVRLSLWTAQCLECPVPKGMGAPSFRGMALTTDGYASTTYLENPFKSREGTVESPTPDLFLLHDPSNGGAFLVGTDGVVRRVTSVDTPIAPNDPRLWFQCLSATEGPDEPTWCALDPQTAEFYRMPGSWDNGLDMSRPGTGEEPWGLRSGSSDTIEAWWDVDGTRQARPLYWPGREGGAVRNPPGGGPMWWSRTPGSDTLDILVGRDRRSPWLVRERSARATASGYLTLSGTPDGGLLAVRTWPRIRIWRADDLLAGDFVLVHDAGPGPESSGAGGLVLHGEEIQLLSDADTAVSHDDGRTWTTVSTWR